MDFTSGESSLLQDEEYETVRDTDLNNHSYVINLAGIRHVYTKDVQIT
jgi:hypothetical protein